ncbi:hypothetical protein EBZ80_23905 [bacterium]|nr:hypothetical protein [bacterium]
MKSIITRSLLVASLASTVAMPAFAKGLKGVCEGADGKVIENVKTEKECKAQGGKVVHKKKAEHAKKQEAAKPAEVKQESTGQEVAPKTEEHK